MLSVIDGLWKDHLLAMDHLKEGIGLRGYAQQDPLVAYKRESFDMFEAMMAQVPGRHRPLPVPDADPRPRRPPDQRGAANRAECSARAAGGQCCVGSERNGGPAMLDAAPREIAIPTRAPSTTIDQLEKEFARKKQRELEAAQPGRSRTTAASPRNAAPAKKSAATIPAPAASARSTRSATARKPSGDWLESHYPRAVILTRRGRICPETHRSARYKGGRIQAPLGWESQQFQNFRAGGRWPTIIKALVMLSAAKRSRNICGCSSVIPPTMTCLSPHRR